MSLCDILERKRKEVERRRTMAFVVKVEGTEAFEISKECVKSVKMTTDIPQDSNARTKDFGATMTIKGKILTAVGGDPFDSTRRWRCGQWFRQREQTATEK